MISGSLDNIQNGFLKNAYREGSEDQGVRKYFNFDLDFWKISLIENNAFRFHFRMGLGVLGKGASIKYFGPF